MTTKANLKLMFFIRKQRSLKDGSYPVYVRINVNGSIADAGIGVNVPLDVWSPESGVAVGRSSETRRVNDQIDNTKTAIMNHFRQMVSEGRMVSSNSLKEAWLGRKQKGKTLLEVFLEHNNKAKMLIGKDFVLGTVKRYGVTYNHLAAFLKKTGQGEDFLLSDVNHKFITDFDFYLRTERNCAHNTIVGNFKVFKKVIKNARANGWMKNDPFANFKMTAKKVDRGYLTEDELAKIQSKKFQFERLEYVKDVFLFGCYTGLAYIDLKELKPENVITGNDGKPWVFTNRAKTGISCHVPLLRPALAILEKYKNNPLCVTKKVLLPVYCNQKMNSYLKEIADLCGIDKNLTSHLARHTFATTVTLNNDVPIESVSKMLGHSSIKMTQIYA
ncbi:MAG: site-specific integrase, partial [Bacteroidetes bacterium]|nr:site-specific integrase [Bacteroidota bacterium]MBU1719941.1 site-specific integrase [Bacteroidota bacterium]